ncbi:15846_t:CDS:2, partial [Dentiscutata erythropus]
MPEIPINKLIILAAIAVYVIAKLLIARNYFENKASAKNSLNYFRYVRKIYKRAPLPSNIIIRIEFKLNKRKSFLFTFKFLIFIMVAKSFVFIALVTLSIGFVLSGQANPLPNNKSPQLFKRSGCEDGSYYSNNYVKIPCDYEITKDCVIYIGQYVIPKPAIIYHSSNVLINLGACDGLNLETPIKYMKITTPRYGIHRIYVRPTHTTYDYSEEHNSSTSSSSSSHSELHVHGGDDDSCGSDSDDCG